MLFYSFYAIGLFLWFCSAFNIDPVAAIISPKVDFAFIKEYYIFSIFWCSVLVFYCKIKSLFCICLWNKTFIFRHSSFYPTRPANLPEYIPSTFLPGFCSSNNSASSFQECQRFWLTKSQFFSSSSMVNDLRWKLFIFPKSLDGFLGPFSNPVNCTIANLSDY